MRCSELCFASHLQVLSMSDAVSFGGMSESGRFQLMELLPKIEATNPTPSPATAAILEVGDVPRELLATGETGLPCSVGWFSPSAPVQPLTSRPAPRRASGSSSSSAGRPRASSTAPPARLPSSSTPVRRLRPASLVPSPRLRPAPPPRQNPPSTPPPPPPPRPTTPSGGFSPADFALTVLDKLPRGVIRLQALTVNIGPSAPRCEGTAKVSVMDRRVPAQRAPPSDAARPRARLALCLTRPAPSRASPRDLVIRVKANLDVETGARLAESWVEASVEGLQAVQIPANLQYTRRRFVTYLDETLAILRDESGTPTILARDGAPLVTPEVLIAA